MKKKVACSILSCMMVLAFVLTTHGAASEPQSGGTLRFDIGEQFTSFNFADNWTGSNEGYGSLIYEGLFVGDWEKGPSGTNEVPYSHC